MFHSVILFSQAPLARGSRALPSVLLAIFHTKIILVFMVWVFSSILLSVELLLTQETRFSKSCSNWKFCFKPQIPLRFPVKTENHWLYRLTDDVHHMHNTVLSTLNIASRFVTATMGVVSCGSVLNFPCLSLESASTCQATV